MPNITIELLAQRIETIEKQIAELLSDKKKAEKKEKKEKEKEKEKKKSGIPMTMS